MIILIGGEKGGSGKSCLAQNMAVFLTDECNANVIIVDCDPQRSTSDWAYCRARNKQLSAIKCIQLFGKIRNDLLKLEKHYHYVIIDCGSQDNLALRASMSVSDYSLIPIRPKLRDINSIKNIDDIVATCLMINPELKASFVITQCPSNANYDKRVLDTKEACSTYGLHVLNNIMYEHDIYDDSEQAGHSVLDMAPDCQAANEIRNLTCELLRVNTCDDIKQRIVEYDAAIIPVSKNKMP
ncbi:AAA family ATPase [Shewanella marina]|uniref:AAA family ATPase n=1 Tax=Shewanella marina TaxID=487319 RepID=UPI00046E7E5F|nr:AAA family ATPase [Shewanella marina]